MHRLLWERIRDVSLPFIAVDYLDVITHPWQKPLQWHLSLLWQSSLACDPPQYVKHLLSLSLSPSVSLSVSAVMSDTTAGAQRTVESAFILPLIRQITQTMDLASRDPNSIPTVDSGHSPARIHQPWERRFPLYRKKEGGGGKLTWTESKKMKGNILYLAKDSSRWTALIWAQIWFRDSMVQTAFNSKWFGSIVFARHSRNREREDERKVEDGRKEEKQMQFTTEGSRRAEDRGCSQISLVSN